MSDQTNPISNGAILTQKILDLLSKTKEALIADLEEEYVTVHKALLKLQEGGEKSDTTLSQNLENSLAVINAVFAKVGYDVSQYSGIQKVGSWAFSLVGETEKLADALRSLASNYENDNNLDAKELSAFLDEAVPHVKAIIQIVKSFADAEWDGIAKEFDEAAKSLGTTFKEQFLTKEFARKVLDHIVMSLLKNAKEVFKDEIEFAKLEFTNLYEEGKDLVESIQNQLKEDINAVLTDVKDAEAYVQNLYNDAIDDAKQMYQNLEEEIKTGIEETKGDAKTFLSEFKEAGPVIAKIVNALSLTYSVLDFLGVVKEKHVTLSIPNDIRALISKVQDGISAANKTIEDATEKINNKVNEIKGDVTDAVTDFSEDLNSGIKTVVDGASNAIADANSKIQEALDTDMQFTSELAGLSQASLGAVDIQMITIYGQSGVNEVKNGLISVLNESTENISASVTEISAGITSVGSKINEVLDSASNFSYPMTIKVIDWESIAELFTKPVSHFKSLYPIDSLADAESLMRRIMGILHDINPDIPDFDSLRKMLESLLRKLQDKAIQLFNEIRDEVDEKVQSLKKAIVQKIQPIITTVKKIIAMLKELALALKEKMYGVLNDAKQVIEEIGEAIQDKFEDVEDELLTIKGDIEDSVKEEWEKVYKSIDETQKEVRKSILETVKDVEEGVEDLEKDLSKAADEVEKTVEGAVEDVEAAVEDAEDALKDAASDANKTITQIAKEIREDIDQNFKFPKIRINTVVNNCILSPVSSTIGDILSTTANKTLEGCDISLDFSPFIDLASSVKELKKQATAYEKIFSANGMEKVSSSELTKYLPTKEDFTSAITNITDNFNPLSSLSSLKSLDPLKDVQNIVVPELQAWAYGVVSSIKTVTSPTVWKNRLDTVITQLQGEFQSDLSNITGLISKEGAMRLYKDASGVKAQLASELAINDYITIVQTAIDDVVLPNPELYFTSFRSCLSTIISKLTDYFVKLYEKVKEAYDSAKDCFKNAYDQVKSEFDSLKEKFENLTDDVEDKANSLYDGLYQKAKDIKDTTIDCIEKFLECIEKLGDCFTDGIGDNLKKIATNLKETAGDFIDNLLSVSKEKLEDLASKIWSNIKNQVITPLIESIKKELLAGLKRLVKKALNKILNALTTVQDEAEQQVDAITAEVQKLFKKLPVLDDLIQAISTMATNVKNVIYNNSELKEALSSLDLADDVNFKDFDINKLNFSNIQQITTVVPALYNKVKDLTEDDSLKKQLFDAMKLEFTLQAVNVAKDVADEASEAIDKALPKVTIPAEYIVWAQNTIQEVVNFVQGDMGLQEIVSLAVALFNDIPDTIKDDIKEMLPSMPELPNGTFKDLVNDVSCTTDLNNYFCNISLLSLDYKKETESGVSLDGKLSLNVFIFLGRYGHVIKEESEESEETKQISESSEESEKTDDSESKELVLKVEKETEEDDETEEKEGRPAIYFMFSLKAYFKTDISLGEKHHLNIDPELSVGQDITADGAGKIGQEGKEDEEVQYLGFCLAKKKNRGDSIFHAWADKQCVSASLTVSFGRKDKAGKASILSTQYLDLNITDYPQVAYVLYNSNYPDAVAEALDLEEKEKKVSSFTAGYLAQLKDLEVILKLRQNEFFSKFLKDDISANFSLSLLYDYLKGFKIGGGYRFHFDIDCSNLKIGSLTLNNLGLDVGSAKLDLGTLEFGIGSTFTLNLKALSMSFENLGLGWSLNVVKPDFSLGDWDLGFTFKFPSGIGIAIDTDAVKGAGLVNYTEDTGELFGALELKVIKKFGISALLLADLGTVKGHSFSLVALVSTTFDPGIPLGMGFSLTGIGGALGLMRMIDSTAMTTAVRNGTLQSIFFVDDIMNHLGEMKQNAIALFPAKNNQFFLGFLGQISYAPIVKCNFGLFLQLPDPTSIIIVGGVNVSIEDTDVIRINVNFAGELDFKKGMSFDASLYDSEIVGIKLEGDVAFRLYWGGSTKGFLFSAGGFHPSYTPEEGMNVGSMKRMSMKLDYKIIKLSLETYMAITSNTFQMGSNIDLTIGWEDYGLIGYLSYDALFQFKPFMFMFDAKAGVAVMIGSWEALKIDLAMHVSGPRPWNISGNASFSILLIPVNVDFDYTWGDTTPELPDKQIEILPLFIEQVNNNSNWTTDSSSRTDDEVTVNMDAEASDSSEDDKPIVLQPFSTLSFSQCAIPLDQHMDLCNNACPTDYDTLTISGFVLGDSEKGRVENDDQYSDFAPSQFINMSVEKKLKSPSFVKMKSGFTLSESDTRKSMVDDSDPVNLDYEYSYDISETTSETDVESSATAQESVSKVKTANRRLVVSSAKLATSDKKHVLIDKKHSVTISKISSAKSDSKNSQICQIVQGLLSSKITSVLTSQFGYEKNTERARKAYIERLDQIMKSKTSNR